MTVNPDKFEVVEKNSRTKDSYAPNINNQTINSENSAKLCGIDIGNILSFDQHISTVFKKQAINAFGKLCGNCGKVSYLQVVYNLISLYFFACVEE